MTKSIIDYTTTKHEIEPAEADNWDSLFENIKAVLIERDIKPQNCSELVIIGGCITVKQQYECTEEVI